MERADNIPDLEELGYLLSGEPIPYTLPRYIPEVVEQLSFLDKLELVEWIPAGEYGVLIRRFEKQD